MKKKGSDVNVPDTNSFTSPIVKNNAKKANSVVVFFFRKAFVIKTASNIRIKIPNINPKSHSISKIKLCE